MNLATWLDNAKITQAELGRRVGLTQGRISQIIRDGTNDVKTARLIHAATDGAVDLHDLFPPATPPPASTASVPA